MEIIIDTHIRIYYIHIISLFIVYADIFLNRGIYRKHIITYCITGTVEPLVMKYILLDQYQFNILFRIRQDIFEIY